MARIVVALNIVRLALEDILKGHDYVQVRSIEDAKSALDAHQLILIDPMLHPRLDPVTGESLEEFSYGIARVPIVYDFAVEQSSQRKVIIQGTLPGNSRQLGFKTSEWEKKYLALQGVGVFIDSKHTTYLEEFYSHLRNILREL